MATLYYQGHGSFRITTADGTTLYVDPYAGKGYDVPADLILVTHGHDDHTHVELVPQKPDCRVITHEEALVDGAYQTFTVGGIQIRAVEAYNQNHDRRCCVGYLLKLDEIKLYAAGDTSRTQMMDTFAAMRLDWALLPIDGVYNMDVYEASTCAKRIGAKHSIPIHMKPGALFDRATAERFSAPGRCILEPGESVGL